jgi:translation initiation factor 2 alpha subunit (eIF-2alpha)
MKMKLLMQWDIRPGHDSQYLEFIVREFVPSVEQMGLQIVGVWYTLYGDESQILVAVVAQNEQVLHQILASQKWEGLLNRLSQHVTNVQTKIVPDRDRFQI